jgi:nucleoside-diphosphate-sugar epimerase
LIREERSCIVCALPEVIETESQLEELLADPYPETVEMMRRLDGDILILGAGGKMGPSLARLAVNAVRAAGVRKRVVAVSRFPERALEEQLRSYGAETIACDLLDPDALEQLPRARNVIFMVGLKFGQVGSEPKLWMTNAALPAQVARLYRDSNLVVYSTGCVYALLPPGTLGSRETDAPEPVGEYAWSCLARERIFEHGSTQYGTRVLFFRLNYAVELRYGVLVDVALAVFERRPVSRSVSVANVIWQGDAINRSLLCLEHTAVPPAILNVTGSEFLDLEDVANEFGRRFGVKVEFEGAESGRAYLSDASRSIQIFGPPRVPVERMMDWIAHWIRRGGRTLGKPTHFEVTDGQFLTDPSKEPDR